MLAKKKLINHQTNGKGYIINLLHDGCMHERFDLPCMVQTSVGDAPAGPSPFGANEPEEETTFTEVTTNDIVASVGDIETTLSSKYKET